MHVYTCSIIIQHVLSIITISAVNVALESMNSALEDGDNRSAFKALQTKEMKFSFLYSDHQEKYINALARERQEGIPRNVMVSINN